MSNLRTETDISKPAAKISHTCTWSKQTALSYNLRLCELLTLSALDRAETKNCLTVEVFSNLWKDLLYIGTFDIDVLYEVAKRLSISIEDYPEWTIISPKDKKALLPEKYQLFILTIIELVREELQLQLQVVKNSRKKKTK
ncbi:MAG: hypothetical protein ACI9BF_000611 [Candidatus Paceibacteria bacterium]|jgi:hypothetical protein